MGSLFVTFALRCLFLLSMKETTQFYPRVMENKHLRCSLWKKQCQILQFGSDLRQYQSGSCGSNNPGGSCRWIWSEPHLRRADGHPGSDERRAGHSGGRLFIWVMNRIGSCLLKGDTVVPRQARIGCAGGDGGVKSILLFFYQAHTFRT